MVPRRRARRPVGSRPGLYSALLNALIDLTEEEGRGREDSPLA